MCVFFWKSPSSFYKKMRKQNKVTRICKICRTEFKAWPSSTTKHCSIKCRNKSLIGHPVSQITKDKIHFAQLGEKNHNWKGGRILHKTGYYLIRQTAHPSRRKCDYVLEHRLVMESMIGRYLRPEEVVHHLNGIKTDNRPENLVVMPKGKHHWSLVIKAMRKRIIELENKIKAHHYI